MDGRVVGGTATDISKFPHQLSLQYFGRHICGATLVTPNTAVTAAHCVSGLTFGFSIRAGTSFTTGGTTVIVKTVVPHPLYSTVNFSNDIAILHLTSPLTLSQNIKVIGLPTSSPVVGANAQVSGWGTTTENGAISNRLLYVDVPVLTDAECRRSYTNNIRPGMFCAGWTKGGKDACQGDSGGPLIQNNKLIGVVSWGVGCARPNNPGVYTNVFQYVNWIKGNMN